MLVARFSRDIEIRRKGQRWYVRAIQTVSLWPPPPPPARLRGAALPQYANDPCYEHDRVASSRKLVNWLAGMRICRDCSGHLLPLHFARRYRIDQFVRRPTDADTVHVADSIQLFPPFPFSFRRKFRKYRYISINFREISLKFFRERERERGDRKARLKSRYICS